MKISEETLKAVENQMDIYRNRITTYNVSIEKLEKMQTNEVVRKSIEGYKKQVDFLLEKITVLNNDLKFLKELS